MRVSASNRHSGLSKSQLWGDYMNYSLGASANTMELDVVYRAVLFQGEHHLFRQWVTKRPGLIKGWDNMVDCGYCSIWTTYFEPLVSKGSESLRTSDFVNQMQSYK